MFRGSVAVVSHIGMSLLGFIDFFTFLRCKDMSGFISGEPRGFLGCWLFCLILFFGALLGFARRKAGGVYCAAVTVE